MQKLEKLEDIERLSNTEKPIWSAKWKGQSIIIKQYMCNSEKKTSEEKNAQIIKEIRNEVEMLKYIENKPVKFPDGIKVPKSLIVDLSKPTRNEKIINAYHYIEKLSGQDLFDWMETNSKLEFGEKKQLLRKIVERMAVAIYILHKNNIVHGDIKLENMMIDVSSSGEINLGVIDFVFSQLINIEDFIQLNNKKCAKEFKIFSGTADYISPELFLHFPYDLFANDVWCLAMTIYSLYTGYFIDRAYDNVKDQVDTCKEYCKRSFMEEVLPKDIYQLLQLIFVEEDKRISMEEIIKYLGVDLMDIDE